MPAGYVAALVFKSAYLLLSIETQQSARPVSESWSATEALQAQSTRALKPKVEHHARNLTNLEPSDRLSISVQPIAR